MTKKKKGLTPYSFASGFVQSRDISRVIAQNDQLVSQGSVWSKLMKWVNGQWYAFTLKWTATRMWVLFEPELQLFSTGPEGIVSLTTKEGTTEEIIDNTDEGPASRGHIRDLRGIGNHIYVCGMGRQVYRREGTDHWIRIDQNMVLPLGEITIAGLNSIDGLNEEDIYAVGYNGEIWRRAENVWKQIDSPTNVILYRVRAIKDNLVFACGQKGVLMRRAGDFFEVIAHDATTDNLWGMEWFKGRLYVSSEKRIYVLTPDDDLKHLDLGAIKTCGHLHANDGVMWSYGTKHVAWTEDAITWHDVTP
jgi:hypothetical protein